jgi:HTH-type transcriptional regulator/antitoxin HipB
VSQARIAEIEANPGLVNFEQLMKLLSVLGVTLTLHEGTPTPASATGQKAADQPASRRNVVVRPKKGSW